LLAIFVKLVVVAVPVLVQKPVRTFRGGAIMTWGGLKGDISVALALFLSESESKSLILRDTYVVVIFSIIAQVVMFNRLAERMGRAPELTDS
jgi:CPA1 family monovalent cation:H+ antiporter